MSDIVCSNCLTPNRPDRRFCRNCGKPLAAGCPACGAQNEAVDRFCGTCGSELPDPTRAVAAGGTPESNNAAAAIAKPATERRRVSVLFA